MATRLEDLRVAVHMDHGGTVSTHYDAAHTADLVEALQTEGCIVIGRDEATIERIAAALYIKKWGPSMSGSHPTSAEYEMAYAVVDALASVQETTTNQSQSDAELVVQEDR